MAALKNSFNEPSPRTCACDCLFHAVLPFCDLYLFCNLIFLSGGCCRKCTVFFGGSSINDVTRREGKGVYDIVTVCDIEGMGLKVS